MRHLIVPVALITALSGCGLHLRGSSTSVEELTAKRIHVDQIRAPGVSAELREMLSTSGVRLSRDPKKSEYTIRLAGEKISRDVLSVSPQTGKVEEFQLTYLVLLSVLRGGGGTLLENEPITLQRDFTFDQDAVLGNFSEEETLRDELTREAAEQVLRRSSVAISRDQRSPSP